MTVPEVTFVVAAAGGEVIGLNGTLPWRLPADLRHFRRLTLGGAVILGRAVWDDLGRPLPERENIVLSRNQAFEAPGARVVHSGEEAMEAASLTGRPIFVLGGAQVYRLLADQATAVEYTRVHADVPGDTFFPALPGTWVEVSRRERAADEANPFAMTFARFERRDGGRGWSSVRRALES